MASTRSERAPLLGGDSASILAAVAAEEGRVDPPRGGGRPDDDESSGRRRRRLGGVAATIATTACLALLGRGSWETLLRIICGPEELGWPYQVVTTVEGQTSSQHVAQAQAAVAAGRFSLLFLGSWRG